MKPTKQQLDTQLDASIKQMDTRVQDHERDDYELALNDFWGGYTSTTSGSASPSEVLADIKTYCGVDVPVSDDLLETLTNEQVKAVFNGLKLTVD